MPTTVTVEYDCGRTYTLPTAIADDSAALRQPAVVDTLVMLADADHDTVCPCATSWETETTSATAR